MEHTDEKTPLLADKQTKEKQIEEGQDAEIEEDVSLLMMLLDPYEPVTKHTHSKLPSPLMLLGLCGGMAAVEIFGIFGAYMFLVSHAHTVFPMCTQADFIDRWMGLEKSKFIPLHWFWMAAVDFPIVLCWRYSFHTILGIL